MGSLWLRKFFLSVAFFAITSVAMGQGSKADYERANALASRTQNKVYKSRIQPYWFGDNARFWYRNDLADGKREFVLVDAKAGSKKPAFDHKRLAVALTKTLEKQIDPDKLPFNRIQYATDNRGVLFTIDRKTWRCNLETYALEEAKAAIDEANNSLAIPAARPSRRTGEETSIVFINKTTGSIRLHWVDTEGNRVAYDTINAGEQLDRRTFGGHVWVVVDAQGRTLGAFEAQESGGTAIIDGTVRTPVPQDQTRRRIQPNANANVSPDGKKAYIYKEFNLWIRDTSTGNEAQLTNDGSAGEGYGGIAYWSPDSKRLAAMKTKQGEEHKVYIVESSPRDQLQPKLHSFDYHKPGDRLPISKPYLFDVEQMREIPISDALLQNPWNITDLVWSRDSRRFSFLYNQRGHQVLRVVGVDGQTGETKAIVEEQSKTFIDYAGKRFFRRLEATNEILWMSERDGWNHLYLYDAETGKVKNQITKGAWVVREVDRVDLEKRQIWFRASGIYPNQDPYYLHYCRVNFDGTGLTPLTQGDGTHTIVFSPDNRYLIDTYSRVDMPPLHELRDVETGKQICTLEKSDASALLTSGWKMPERFVAKGRDGSTDIYGVIIRPSNFDPKRRYPIIENIYAGPQSSFVPKAWFNYNRMMEIAELGFIVVQIDGMGTSNRSKAFHDVCWKNLKDAGFPDRILWIQAAAKRYPYMNIAKVGIYGGSAGGQNAMGGLLFHPDFYKVGVADCGCHDNRMDKVWWNELWMGYPVGNHYSESSNVDNAHRLKGKLLLIVGEMDRNVDPASTMQVVNALVKADKDFDLLVVPGGGHGIAESPYGRRRRQDFFVRHLLGVEPRHE